MLYLKFPFRLLRDALAYRDSHPQIRAIPYDEATAVPAPAEIAAIPEKWSRANWQWAILFERTLTQMILGKCEPLVLLLDDSRVYTVTSIIVPDRPGWGIERPLFHLKEKRAFRNVSIDRVMLYTESEQETVRSQIRGAISAFNQLPSNTSGNFASAIAGTAAAYCLAEGLLACELERSRV